jgi:hypothetical protein
MRRCMCARVDCVCFELMQQQDKAVTLIGLRAVQKGQGDAVSKQLLHLLRLLIMRFHCCTAIDVNMEWHDHVMFWLNKVCVERRDISFNLWSLTGGMTWTDPKRFGFHQEISIFGSRDIFCMCGRRGLECNSLVCYS